MINVGEMLVDACKSIYTKQDEKIIELKCVTAALKTFPNDLQDCLDDLNSSIQAAILKKYGWMHPTIRRNLTGIAKFKQNL